MSEQAPLADFYDRAACGGRNARAFNQATPAEAKRICGGCPVRVECLHNALDSKVTNGIWGGLTYPERRKLPALPADRGDALVMLRQALQSTDAADLVDAPRRMATRSKAPARRKKQEAGAGRRPEAVPAPREDVAERLRQGRTQRQIMTELNVSQRVISATRKAYKIPYQGGPGFRYSPQQRAENERRTIEMLRAGATYQQIMDEVGISQPTIIAIRRKAGLPSSNNVGGLPARSRTEGLAANSEPYGEGHVRWTGPKAGRMPQLYAESRRFNARHLVFELHHGRAPFGPIRSNCGITDCIAGAHLTDTLLRAAEPDKEQPVTVQALKDLLDEIDTQGGPEAARQNRLHLPDEGTRRPMNTTTHAAQAANSDNLPVDKLLAWGDAHVDPEVQDQVARARAAVVGLRARYAADQELTAICDEAAQLEKRLAELRAREAELAPKKKRKSPAYVRDYDTRTVRDWAQANGVDCPRVGQIPKRVLDAWRAATSDGGGA